MYMRRRVDTNLLYVATGPLVSPGHNSPFDFGPVRGGIVIHEGIKIQQCA